MLPTASGPRLVCKDIGSGAVAARRVGNVFYDRGVADVFFRHLMQMEGRMRVTKNRLQCDMKLQGCQPGHVLPEHPKTMRPVAEDIVRSPNVSTRKSALYDSLRSADGFHVQSVDGTVQSWLQDAPSACQQVQRVLPFGGLPVRGRARTLSRRTEPAVHR